MWRQASRRPEETRIVRVGPDPNDAGRPDPPAADPGGQLQFTSRCAVRLAATGSRPACCPGCSAMGRLPDRTALVLIASLPMRRAVATRCG